MPDKNFRHFYFLLLLTVLVLRLPVFAQMGRNSSGTGGKNTIQGSIFLPNGTRSGDVSITVKLESTSFSSLSVIADRNGSFSFDGLTPGSYTIIIDAGESFETTREPVYIDENPSSIPNAGPNSSATVIPSIPRTVRVPIYLQIKKNARVNNNILNAKLIDVPKDALKHYEKGVELGRAGKSTDAVVEFKQATAIYPKFSLALAELGRQYLMLGNLDEALSALRSSVDIDPKYFDAKLDYGVALLNKKQLDAAEKQLKDAAQINVAAVMPHYYLGIVFVEKRNLDEAQNELELGKKLASDKSYPQLHRMLGGIYWGKKQYKSAADELEIYLQLSPNAKDAEAIRQSIKDLRSKQ